MVRQMNIGFGMVLCLLWVLAWSTSVRPSVPRLLMGADVFGDIHITKIEMGRETDDGLSWNVVVMALAECTRRRRQKQRAHSLNPNVRLPF